MRILKAGDVKRWNAWMENIEGLSPYKQRAALEKMLRSMYRIFDPKDPYAATLIETTEQALISVMQQINPSRQKAIVR